MSCNVYNIYICYNYYSVNKGKLHVIQLHIILKLQISVAEMSELTLVSKILLIDLYEKETVSLILLPIKNNMSCNLLDCFLFIIQRVEFEYGEMRGIAKMC